MLSPESLLVNNSCNTLHRYKGETMKSWKSRCRSITDCNFSNTQMSCVLDCENIKKRKPESITKWKSRCRKYPTCEFSNKYQLCYEPTYTDLSNDEYEIPDINDDEKEQQDRINYLLWHGYSLDDVEGNTYYDVEIGKLNKPDKSSTSKPTLGRVMTDELTAKLDLEYIASNIKSVSYKLRKQKPINIMVFKNDIADGCDAQNKTKWKASNKRIIQFLNTTDKQKWKTTHGKHNDRLRDCQAISLYWCLQPSQAFNSILRHMPDRRFMDVDFISRLLKKYINNPDLLITLYNMQYNQLIKFLSNDTSFPRGYCTLLIYSWGYYPNQSNPGGHTIICGKHKTDGEYYLLDPQAVRNVERIICVADERPNQNVYANYWVGEEVELWKDRYYSETTKSFTFIQTISIDDKGPANFGFQSDIYYQPNIY